LALASTTALTFGALREARETQFQVSHAHYVETRITAVLDDMVNTETGVRGYLLTGELEFLDPYWQGSEAIAIDLQYLQVAVENDTAERQILRLRVLVKRRLDILGELVRRTDEGSVESRTTLALLRHGRVVMDDIRAVLGRMSTDQRAKVQALQFHAQEVHRRALLVAVGGAPMGMVIALLVVLAFNDRMIRRLARMEDNVRRLELGEPMGSADDGHDEIGRLSRALVRSGTEALELQAELQRLATVDPLTELANRRGLMPLLEHQLDQARRHGHPVAIVFVDVDGLKTLNDELGHSMGDEMLCETAAILRDSFRAADVVARLGGDEFAVMLTAESASTADAAVSRLLGAIESSNRLPGRPYALSLSIGVACFDPEAPVSAEGLLEAADSSMYDHKRSKREGREAQADTTGGDTEEAAEMVARA
jgi:diguanylate cyclase (GGDEF)-like protein